MPAIVKKIQFGQLLSGLILFGIFALAGTAEAAIVSIKAETSPVAVGDTVYLSVVIDTQGQSINVLDGSINFISGSENISFKDLSVAGSDFTLWTNKPSLAADSKSISFIGGVPGGINESGASVFRIAITAEKEGQLVLTPSAIKAYLNDGRATPVQIQVNPLNFSIVAPKADGPKDELASIIIGDNKKPYNLVASIGQDPALYDGQTFVAISALDGESGIDRFEVIEGNRPAVRTGANYVFQNQKALEPTVIIAYDKAGNSRKIYLREKTEWEKISIYQVIFYLVIAVFIVILAIFGLKKFANIFKKFSRN